MSRAQVQRYIKAYAEHFDLNRHVRLNCKLLRLRWHVDERAWEALYCDSTLAKFYKIAVDFVTVCTGIYSQPYVPEYAGADCFAGTQLHAKDFVDMSLAKGRRVLIVGAGKTAMDCVCGLVASRTAASVTLLYRQAHWPVPRSVWGLSVRSLLFNRAIGAMLPPYYEAGAARRAAAALTKPIRTLFWRSLQTATASKFRIAKTLKPRLDMPSDLFHGGQVVDDTLSELIADEVVTSTKGEINRIVRNGVILQDNSFLPVDLILYCTGYSKSYDFLEGSMRERLGLQKDGLYLYRNCLPHAVPHLAFVGSEVSTFSNIVTHGLQALWLARVLAGDVKLPPPDRMVDDIRAQQRWRREIMPPQRSRGAALMLYMQHYHDQLLRDMGASPKRKGLNLLAECFGAYTAADYTSLATAAPPPAAESVRPSTNIDGIKITIHDLDAPPTSLYPGIDIRLEPPSIARAVALSFDEPRGKRAGTVTRTGTGTGMTTGTGTGTGMSTGGGGGGGALLTGPRSIKSTRSWRSLMGSAGHTVVRAAQFGAAQESLEYGGGDGCTGTGTGKAMPASAGGLSVSDNMSSASASSNTHGPSRSRTPSQSQMHGQGHGLGQSYSHGQGQGYSQGCGQAHGYVHSPGSGHGHGHGHGFPPSPTPAVAQSHGRPHA
ncbi:hypothetical protein HYH03_004952 [Edaphochlamys debaryana]|uniref:Flavin-containing monooxygenase n=1 Tax=Edaphochlamys debaryana TaxID=47281 RepID=A0A836C1I5_9CHLO|nr:hypothetical protein HYH03_004952 [Edaphochlamys debaryana]|eukprot:KAG2496946.1 hypothetical protein HYH03_004952 [Edaphochlamys debaryana]